LFKFDEGAEVWNELSTTFMGEEGDNYLFEAETDSFSFFSIGEIGVADTPVSDGTGTTGTGGDEGGSGAGKVILIILIIAVIVGVIVWFFVKRQQ